MDNTQTNTVPATPAIPEPVKKPSVVRKAGVSLLLFSLVFTGLLSASWTYVLPRLTRIQVQGKAVDLSVILPYEQNLRAQIAEVESKRNMLAVPLTDDAYDALKRSAACYPMLEDVEDSIADIVKETGEEAVLFSDISLNRGVLTLTGDVRNVGPRSMTVLAQFIEDLRAATFVASVTTPAFTREKDDVVGFHSPFSFSVTLKASESCPSASSSAL